MDSKDFKIIEKKLSERETITDAQIDSRLCTQSSAFFSFNADRFILPAIENGAKLIVTQNPDAQIPAGTDYLIVDNVRIAYAVCSAALNHWPAEKLRIIGVTGTDGKTTTSSFLYQMLNNMGIKTALLSTTDIDDGSGLKSSPFRQSTPEAWYIHSFLASCIKNKVNTVILETTSHGLSEQTQRLYSIKFTGAIYTTITSEHLEFHKSLENYIQCKLNLARNVLDGGFVCAPEDNPYLDEIRQACPPSVQFSTYSLPTHERNLAGNFVKCGDAKYHFCYGPSFFLKNAAGAICAANIICKEHCEKELEKIKPVNGRFEVIEEKGRTFIIDFAHTADAFEKLFSEVRALEGNSPITVVFGAAGERDTTKRAPMGEAAAKFAEKIIITDEDPRKEDPLQIAKMIMKGIGNKEVQIINDRTQAIVEAVNSAKEGSVTLFLGKGHEKTIEYAGEKRPWNEKQAVLKAIGSAKWA